MLLFGAAAISAVYEALAQPAGLSEGADPMEQILLASLVGNRIGKTYTDPALHLSERIGERIEPAQLLAYRYASPGQGPKSGNREVHFLHRSVATCPSAVFALERENLVGIAGTLAILGERLLYSCTALPGTQCLLCACFRDGVAHLQASLCAGADLKVQGHNIHSCGVDRQRLRKRSSFSGFTSDTSHVFAAPLVVFLPADDIQALKERTVQENIDWNGKEYTVERPNQVEQLLEDALRCSQC